jgi:membrane associated rhomboid family serine protease
MLDFDRQSQRGDAGGRLADSIRGWLAQFGSVTHFLMFLTVAVYLLQLAGAMFHWNGVERALALSAPDILRGFVWQPVTYMFLHADLWHILINLLVLWFFGREVEYFIGPKAFTRLYFLGGLAGAALWLGFNFNSNEQVLGASAAVLACVVAFATLFPEREITLLLFFFIPVRLKAKYLALIAVAFDLVPLLTHRVSSVAHLAHLGGALLGYVYIKSLGYGVAPWWLRAWQDVRASRPTRQPQPRLSRDEFIREQVDPILDKISREGLQSLTKQERKILESAKDLMQKQQR